MLDSWYGLKYVSRAEVHAAVHRLVRAIEQNQSGHAQNLLKAFRLYGNFGSQGYAAGNYFRATFGKNNRLTLNVIKSCVDTIVARIGISLPKPTFLTSGGTWSEQKKAKRLDKFCQGIFHQTGFKKTGPRVLRDAVVFGKGWVKVLEDARKRVCIERVFPGEMIVDEMEGVDGKPPAIHQRRTIAKEKLLGMFPEIKGSAERRRVRDLITNSKAAKEGSPSAAQVESAALVTVIESWHLPSTVPAEIDQAKLKKLRKQDEADFGDRAEKYLMEGHDGRHAITITDGTLLIEAWRDEFFPFVDLDWCSGPLRGFWPNGLPIELMGIQYEINKISRKIQESIDWCVPKAFVEAHSQVTLAHLDDIAGGIIRYTGTMPQIQALQTISPELLGQVDRLVRQAYEMAGVSQLAASSKKPQGLESGAAIREFDDFQSERFATVESEFQEFVMAVALQCIRLARRIATSDGEYAVTTPSRRKSMSEVKWTEIDLEDTDFIMQVFPSSALPRTPAGRLAMVQDLINLGFLEQQDIIRLLDFPDLEAVNQLAEASAEFTAWQLERILDGEEEMPQPYQDLKYALRHAQETYLMSCTMSDITDDRRESLQRYMQGCHELMKAATAQAAPAMPMPGMGGPAPVGPGAPSGAPGAPPPGAGAVPP